ncbi:MAG: hypothetical protein L0271_03020 [Gemmatimonadetes bacterium]|nr:hypothetical protein [Gemmatimonadota bacterium]
MKHAPRPVIPFSFDLSAYAPRTVASLYSHLVTRPTGRALRLGIESQLGEMGGCCLSILDFTQVVVLDYSCADEAVAKLLLRYGPEDRPADVYFIARGLGERHREPLQAVLERQGLALVVEAEGGGFELLGVADTSERSAWAALERARNGDATEIAQWMGGTVVETRRALDGLTSRRVLVRQSPVRYRALSTLVEFTA